MLGIAYFVIADIMETGDQPASNVNFASRLRHGNSLPTQKFKHTVDANADAHQSTERLDELSVSSHRDLVVANNNCIVDTFTGGGTPGCTAKDVSFLGVTGFVVYDERAEPPNENGTVFGACRGNDDYINVSFTVDFSTSGQKYDLGMYIAVDGNTALTGRCDISSLQAGTYGGITVAEIENPPDKCLDIDIAGTVTNYPFAPLTLRCFDSEPTDGFMDFDIGIVWGGRGESYCDVNEPANVPKARTSSKCWYDGTKRVKLNSE